MERAQLYAFIFIVISMLSVYAANKEFIQHLKFISIKCRSNIMDVRVLRQQHDFSHFHQTNAEY